MDKSRLLNWLHEARENGTLDRLSDGELEDTNLLYKSSLKKLGDTAFIIIKLIEDDFLLVIGENNFDFSGMELNFDNKIYTFCKMDNFNAKILRSLFPFTIAQKLNSNAPSFGFGDRLGIAGPGFIQSCRESVFDMVLAQQSVRELELAGRDIDDVIDKASWSSFQEDYHKSWGADGDHIKDIDAVKDSLKAGCSFITLDISEHIDNSVYENNKKMEVGLGEKIDNDVLNYIEDEYFNKTISLQSNFEFELQRENVIKTVLRFWGAIRYIEECYKQAIKIKSNFNFEISIDETLIPTTASDHYIIASELTKREIKIYSIAPRFIGEFQKAIDYIGDLEKFRMNIRMHYNIAKNFGHRLSIHSGSDKFSIYKIIWQETQGVFHIKISGTNWLSALRCIAKLDYNLFMDIFAIAIKTFDKSNRHYHLTPNLEEIPREIKLKDIDSEAVLFNDAMNQVLHVSYGEVLKIPELKSKIMDILNKNKEIYWSELRTNIHKHLDSFEIVHEIS